MYVIAKIDLNIEIPKMSSKTFNYFVKKKKKDDEMNKP